MKTLCSKADELQVCPECYEWTTICEPCCTRAPSCGECDGSGFVDEDEDTDEQ